MLSKKQFTTDINYKVQRSAKRTPKERSAVYNINNRYMVKLGNRKLHTYLLVTAHYIDSNWELQAFVLETLSFPERHTGVNIADKLKGLVERWAIMDSVMMVSHDQASNMKMVMDIFLKSVTGKASTVLPIAFSCVY